MTFRGHLRSKICSPFESPYMTSYLTSIDTFSLSRTVFEIFDFKLSLVLNVYVNCRLEYIVPQYLAPLLLILLPSPSNKAGWAFTVNCSGIMILKAFDRLQTHNGGLTLNYIDLKQKLINLCFISRSLNF